MTKQPGEILPSLVPKSKKELAREYDLSTTTIRTWCKRIKIDTRGKLSIREVRAFYEYYGVPVREFAG